MPRRSRIVVPGLAHHITQRGNHRNSVFLSDDCRNAYLNDLREYAEKYHVDIIAYCLMNNHVHLVLVPESPGGLARALAPVHLKVSQRLNRKQKSTGINWQGRYFSSPMEDAYLCNALNYVHLNPVRAGIVDRPDHYRWSSARAHLYRKNNPFLTIKQRWASHVDNAAGVLIAGSACYEKPEYVAIRDHTKQNTPLGTDEFIEKLSAQFGRDLRLRSRGKQPRKHE